MVEFETAIINDTAWIVRVMPDGRRQRVGRQRDLDATVEAICATPEYGTYEAATQVWKERADLQRRAKLARGEGETAPTARTARGISGLTSRSQPSRPAQSAMVRARSVTACAVATVGLNRQALSPARCAVMR